MVTVNFLIWVLSSALEAGATGIWTGTAAGIADFLTGIMVVLAAFLGVLAVFVNFLALASLGALAALSAEKLTEQWPDSLSEQQGLVSRHKSEKVSQSETELNEHSEPLSQPQSPDLPQPWQLLEAEEEVQEEDEEEEEQAGVKVASEVQEEEEGVQEEEEELSQHGWVSGHKLEKSSQPTELKSQTLPSSQPQSLEQPFLHLQESGLDGLPDLSWSLQGQPELLRDMEFLRGVENISNF